MKLEFELRLIVKEKRTDNDQIDVNLPIFASVDIIKSSSFCSLLNQFGIVIHQTTEKIKDEIHARWKSANVNDDDIPF